MTATPPPTQLQSHLAWTLLLDDVEVPNAHCREIHLRAGAEPDKAIIEFEIDSNLPDRPGLQNIEFAPGKQHLWTIRQTGGNAAAGGGAQASVDVDLFWGARTFDKLALGESIEVNSLNAVVAPFLFGDPMEGPLSEESGGTAVTMTAQEIVFNPERDGLIEPNMSDALVAPHDYRPWIHPDALRTAGAQQTRGRTADVWTLEEAIWSLLWITNETETYITNPDKQALIDLFADENEATEGPRLKNRRLKPDWLPHLLAELLEPLGYSFTVDLERVPDPAADPTDPNPPLVSQRKLRLFKRGAGPEREAFHHRIGESYTPKQQVAHLAANFDTLSTVNEWVGRGAAIRHEDTFELEKAWDEADDGTAIAELKKDASGWEARRNVWRKWALNEAGDLDGLRSGATVYDFSTIFEGKYEIRRRRFLPTLSHDPGDNTSFGVWLEYSTDAGATWKHYDGGYSVSNEECAIWFNAPDPQREDSLNDLIAAAGSARVRVTATVEEDQRLEYTAAKADDSASGFTIRRVLDLGQRFVKQTRHAGSTFEVNFPSNDPSRDDSAELGKYMDQVNSKTDAAVLSCSLILDGIVTAYRIGDLITKIAGRNISLRTNTTDVDEPQYPQVVGITYLPDQPSTELVLDDFRESPLQA